MLSLQFIELCIGKRFSLDNEKQVQKQVQELLKKNGIEHIREYKLDDKNIPDFFFINTGLCVEIKIKGGKKAIYRQLVRYSEFEQVEALILLTNKSMSLPLSINNKPTKIINMGMSWL